MFFLGIDTSNYTTSVALYDSDNNAIFQKKKLLPVKSGEKGLRQSDAVFHHTAQFYPLALELFNEHKIEISAIGVSSKPRNIEGSYMPCFTVGINLAKSIGAVIDKPVFEFSHQCGHISAALYSVGLFDEFKKREFIAFHISGGTTEMLLVTPDYNLVFNTKVIGGTLDLNAGQAVDRVGLMLGMDFPCGVALEKLAFNSKKIFSPHISVKDGNCNLSGLENICEKMHNSGYCDCDVAMFCLTFISDSILAMADYARNIYGNIPIVFAGGVMSDSIIKNRLNKIGNCYFAKPEFSCDNAAGTALMACERRKNLG